MSNTRNRPQRARTQRVRKTYLLIQMQHKHDARKRHHGTQDGHADPRDPLSRAQIQLLVPLVWLHAGVDYELRVRYDHLERGDASARRTREQVLDVIVRPAETEERVWCVQSLVRCLRELRDLRSRASA